MRKCRNCKAGIPKIKESKPVERKGFCTFDCMAAYGITKAQESKKKAARKKLRADRERIKTKAEHAKEAQAAFNAWVRERDKDLPCISCQRYHQGQYHAGHYRTVGACPELRFEPLNNNKQCAPCNNHLSGNIVEYRINLLKKIGAEKLEWLEGSHEPKRYTINDFKEIKSTYRKKLKKLKGDRE